MAHAVFDTVAVDMLAGPDGPQRHLLRANGSTLIKPGFIAVYQEGTRRREVEDDSDHMLPAMKTATRAADRRCIAEQHFTEPPPRYSEASLVKALEEHGIGRPSTYATHHLDAAGPRIRRARQPALHRRPTSARSSVAS